MNKQTVTITNKTNKYINLHITAVNEGRLLIPNQYTSDKYK